MDYTQITPEQQAAMLVRVMGLERAWTGDLSKMGTIMFLNGETKRVISAVYQVDEETVLKAMGDALASLP